MKIVISNTSENPLYQQIKDQIKDAILREELVERDALPSIRSFANDLKVSVLTIRRVYDELENYGHGGRTNPAGEGMGEFTIYDWGNGAAAEAYNRILDKFGKIE